MTYAPGGIATHKPVEKLMTDSQGNCMFAVDNGRTIELFTQLHNDTKRRYIGTIDLETKILTVKRKRAIHLHRETNSYGFNYHVVTTGTRFNKIQIIDERGSYLIPVDVVKFGKVLNFNKAGFERQIFLSLDVINNYRSKSII